jgi:hypothetical protein
MGVVPAAKTRRWKSAIDPAVLASYAIGPAAATYNK